MWNTRWHIRHTNAHRARNKTQRENYHHQHVTPTSSVNMEGTMGNRQRYTDTESTSTPMRCDWVFTLHFIISHLVYIHVALLEKRLLHSADGRFLGPVGSRSRFNFTWCSFNVCFIYSLQGYSMWCESSWPGIRSESELWIHFLSLSSAETPESSLCPRDDWWAFVVS